MDTKSNHQKTPASTIRDKYYPAIGSNLKEKRLSEGYTQKEIASILDISRTQVINYENGDQLTVLALLMLSKVYGCRIETFFPECFR